MNFISVSPLSETAWAQVALNCSTALGYWHVTREHQRPWLVRTSNLTHIHVPADPHGEDYARLNAPIKMTHFCYTGPGDANGTGLARCAHAS